MSKDLVHDSYRSMWNGDITTLCGLKINGGKGWSSRFLWSSINCLECQRIRKQTRHTK